MLNVAVLVSGGGTNLQALLDAQQKGELHNGRIACVISSKEGAYALTRAHNAGVPAEVLAKRGRTQEEYDHALLQLLEQYHIDLVVLAGFLTILSESIIRAYPNRIINVHPSLIPSFCGKGYYGLKVHEAALQYGVKLTGATVHFVNEIADGGAIILQKAAPVLPNDTPETLQRRVMEQCEWELLPKAVSLFCEGKLSVCGNQVTIKE